MVISNIPTFKFVPKNKLFGGMAVILMFLAPFSWAMPRPSLVSFEGLVTTIVTSEETAAVTNVGFAMKSRVYVACSPYSSFASLSIICSVSHMYTANSRTFSPTTPVSIFSKTFFHSSPTALNSERLRSGSPWESKACNPPCTAAVVHPSKCSNFATMGLFLVVVISSNASFSTSYCRLALSPMEMPDSHASSIFHRNIKNLLASESVVMGHSSLSSRGLAKSVKAMVVRRPVAVSMGCASWSSPL
mmetsp:Transcript_10015/g.18332  ORF Transcript_10015/g.18332 Transcript_10015/m.18332 type:complete len:246 (+) Transcript_10015:1236-1973(+)